MLNHEEFVWGYNYILHFDKNDEIYFTADISLGEEKSVANEINLRKSDIIGITYFTGTIKREDGTFEEEPMVKVYMKNGGIFYVVDSENEFDFDDVE